MLGCISILVDICINRLYLSNFRQEWTIFSLEESSSLLIFEIYEVAQFESLFKLEDFLKK